MSKSAKQIRRHDQKALLSQGAKLSAVDVERLAASLEEDFDSIEDRIRIIGYYNNILYTTGGHREAPSLLFEQISWIFRNALDLPMFSGLLAAECALSRDQVFALYKILLDGLAKFEHDKDFLVNTLHFLCTNCRGKDDHLVSQLQTELEAIRSTPKS